MAKFVLAHGGGHTSWHWNLVQPLLESAGHCTVVPDLPMDNPDAGVADWADVVCDSLTGQQIDDDVIAVGHSLAGLMLPVLAERIPLRRIVFLAANVPVPGLAYSEYLKEHPEAKTFPFDRITYDDQGRSVIDWSLARDAYYHDVELNLAREAFENCRPVATTGYTEVCPLSSWPSVQSSYILCRDDRATNPDWSRRVSMQRLGASAIELPGGHSPFLTYPKQLTQALHQLVS